MQHKIMKYNYMNMRRKDDPIEDICKFIILGFAEGFWPLMWVSFMVAAIYGAYYY